MFSLVQKNKPLPRGLKIRWHKDKGFFAENAFSVEVDNAEEALKQFHYGLAQKIMGSHNLNASSSRSHCIFTMQVEKLASEETQWISQLSLVDLAGSERLDQTGAEGKTKQESIEINKSLFVLRNVISALAKQSEACDKSQSTHESSSKYCFSSIKPLYILL